MAEARAVDEEESLRDPRDAAGARRNPRAPGVAPDRADRNKPEHRQPSTQGALSSIRAAIKRTSNRTAAPADSNRDRRRPEITILAAEPLPTNTWFPGAPGPFPPAPPPPAQPSWTGSLTVQLPPPSYEQVIREKSREQNTQVSSVATSTSCSSSSSSSSSPSSSLSSNSASSSRHTSTIATQTDPEPKSCTKPQMRRPPKPPRPTLPLAPKPTQPVLTHTHSLIQLDEPDTACSTNTPAPPPGGVQTPLTYALEPLIPIVPDPSDVTRKSQPKAEVAGHPRPRPRSKASLQSVVKEEPETREVKVQTLVRLKDNNAESVFCAFTDTSLDLASNKYLQDLLDVFGCPKQDEGNAETEKRAEEEKAPTSACDPAVTRPEPRPRTQTPKRLIAAKPCNPAPSGEDTRIPSEQNKSLSHPVPAPRPLAKHVAKQEGCSEEQNEPCRLRPPPRPPLAACKSGAFTQEDVQPGEMPFKSSGRRSSEDSSTAAPAVSVMSSSSGSKGPAKPQSQRKPPPPTHSPKHTHTQDHAVSGVNVNKSCITSPSHEATESRPLPLRPPPIKSNKAESSSVTPALANQHSGYREVKRGPPLPPRPKPGHPLYRGYTSKIPLVNPTEIPPSSDHEESCSEKEHLLVTLDATSEPTGCPGVAKGQRQDEPLKTPETNTNVRCRARFAFDGEDGELTLRDDDVVTLTEYVNDEWGRGSLGGRTGLFPLNFVELIPESPAETPEPDSPEPGVCVGDGPTGRALYDFTPESEDELCLKVGDVVSSLEEVDEEWFVGEFAGRRGIVPKNYIQVL